MNNNNPSDNINTDIWGRKIERPKEKQEVQEENNKPIEALDTPKIVGNLGEEKKQVLEQPDIPTLKSTQQEVAHNTFFNQIDVNKQLNEHNTLSNGMAASTQSTIQAGQAVNQNSVNQQEVANSQQQSVPSSTPEVSILESKSIGTIKKDKQKSPVAMLILFTVLIGTIFFVPEITPYFSDLLDKLHISDNSDVFEEIPTPPQPDDSEEEEPVDEEPVIQTYLIDPTIIAKYENLEISNVSKTLADNIYYFNYTLKNTDIQNSFDFATNRIYIDFYQDNTYLGRALINIDNLGGGANTTLQSPINETVYNNANSFQVINRSVSDYPISELGTVITCEAPNRTLTYTFQDNKLVNIKDVYNYTRVDDNSYTVNFLNYQAKAMKIDESDVATASVLAIDTGFTYTANINYTTDVDLTTEDPFYYKKDTSKDVLNYEIESLGFTCH